MKRILNAIVKELTPREHPINLYEENPIIAWFWFICLGLIIISGVGVVFF